MKKIIPYFLIPLAVMACEPQPEQQNEEEMEETEAVSPENETNEIQRSEADTEMQVESGMLEKIWESDTIYNTSESVLYDKVRDRLYVSSIVGEPADEDGNGFISATNLNGEVINVYHFSGYLDAPKGMALKGDRLYVTNIDALYEIDVKTNVSTEKVKIDTAQFLNDVAVGPEGAVYFSDSRTNTIYKLQNNEVSVFLNSDELNGPNGLYFDGNTLMVTTMNGGQVLKINMDNKNITEFASGIGAGDGIVPVGNGSWLVSSWTGKVFLIDSQGNKKLLLNTEDDNMNAADIEYIQDENMLLVPTFNGNSVIAYRLNLDKQES